MRVKVLLFSISLLYLCECARLGADFLLALSCPQPTSCSSRPRSSMPCHVVVHSALTVGQDSVVVPFNVVRAMLYGPCSRHHAYCSAISFIPFSHSFSRDLLFFFSFLFALLEFLHDGVVPTTGPPGIDDDDACPGEIYRLHHLKAIQLRQLPEQHGRQSADRAAE